VRRDGTGGYWASDDKHLIDVARVHGWLSREAYWAKGRSIAVVASSIEHSLVVGLYAPDGAQVGFARVVTDRSTFGWLCDVFVDPAHRGLGLGSPWQARSDGWSASPKSRLARRVSRGGQPVAVGNQARPDFQARCLSARGLERMGTH
jgi:GNAT superfamily N-acetyltransferase